MTHVQAFLKDEQGITTVEIILILVVLISLVIIFKKQLTNLVNKIFSKITSQNLIHSVSEKSNMKTFREHLKTQECTEISPDEYQQNNYSPLAEVGVFSTEIKIMCLVSCAA